MDERLSLFRSRCEDQNAVVRETRSEEEAIRLMRMDFKERNVKTVAISMGNECLAVRIGSALREDGIEVLMGPSDPIQINACDAGVTFPALAVAETGSIVEVTTDDLDRSISALPRIHACYIEKESIVKTLDEAVERLMIMNSRSDRFTISFISGPSKTSDIELRQLLGVHGPHELLIYLRM